MRGSRGPLSALALLLAGGIASGCGGVDVTNEASKKVDDPRDKRSVAVQCINDQGLEAREVDRRGVEIGPDGGTRLRFFLSTGEAESFQFDGNAQGAEQIGAVLLYVGDAPDDELKLVEDCIDNL